MNKLFKLSTRSVLLIAGLIVLGSCKDTWNEHYSFKETESKYPVAKLAETLGGISEFSNFCKALENTLMCDKHGRPIEDMTYMKLLSDDQFLTVWAPSNSALTDAEWEPYIKKNKTDAENLEVGQKFIENHIARFRHTVGDTVESKVYMLNGKAIRSHSAEIAGNPYHGSDKNIRCSNGVLHVVQEQLPFLNSIYEEIEVNPEFSMIYDFLRAYNNDSLDEDRSVSRGVDQDGNKIYVDSVTIFSNTILQALEALVYEEDSNYRALLPTNEAFQARYDEVYPLFKFNPSVDGADSLQEMNAKRYVLNDLFFNMNQNTHVQDSLVATTYNNRRPDFHVYYHPYETVNDTVGIMQTYEHKIACSNGEVYKFSEWPVSAADEVFHYIKVEAERGNSVNNATDYTNKCEVRNRTGFLGFGLSENGFADAVPTSSSVNPEIGFNIPNTLSGTYDIYAVMPSSWFKNLSDADMRPYQFRAQLFEMDSKGQMPTSATVRLADNATLSNNPENLVDTVFIDTYTFQNCYLNQEGNGVILKLVSYITSSKTRDFSREMLIDCILLIPHKDE